MELLSLPDVLAPERKSPETRPTHEPGFRVAARNDGLRPVTCARCVLAGEISRSEPDNLLRLPEIVTDGYRGAGDHERGLVSINGIQFGERPTRHICADPHLIRSAKSDFHLIQLARQPGALGFEKGLFTGPTFEKRLALQLGWKSAQRDDFSCA